MAALTLTPRRFPFCPLKAAPAGPFRRTRPRSRGPRSGMGCSPRGPAHRMPSSTALRTGARSPPFPLKAARASLVSAGAEVQGMRGPTGPKCKPLWLTPSPCRRHPPGPAQERRASGRVEGGAEKRRVPPGGLGAPRAAVLGGRGPRHSVPGKRAAAVRAGAAGRQQRQGPEPPASLAAAAAAGGAAVGAGPGPAAGHPPDAVHAIPSHQQQRQHQPCQDGLASDRIWDGDSRLWKTFQWGWTPPKATQASGITRKGPCWLLLSSFRTGMQWVFKCPVCRAGCPGDPPERLCSGLRSMPTTKGPARSPPLLMAERPLGRLKQGEGSLVTGPCLGQESADPVADRNRSSVGAPAGSLPASLDVAQGGHRTGPNPQLRPTELSQVPGGFGPSASEPGDPGQALGAAPGPVLP